MEIVEHINDNLVKSINSFIVSSLEPKVILLFSLNGFISIKIEIIEIRMDPSPDKIPEHRNESSTGRSGNDRGQGEKHYLYR
jgi:hypothetical protein